MTKLSTTEITDALDHIDQLLGYDDDFTSEPKISAAFAAHRNALQALCALIEQLNDRQAA